MAAPILFVICGEPGGIAAFERVRLRRHNADYRVVAEGSPEAGLATLGQLVSRGEEVALVLADQ